MDSNGRYVLVAAREGEYVGYRRYEFVDGKLMEVKQ